MRYITFDAPGAPETLEVAEMDAPRPGPGQVLIAVEAAGVSHADVLQRQGKYPPPPGASPILGLEVAGKIAACGEGVTRWHEGERVCALTNGG
ncbi:MAG TPA: alcohol dehydrogenase catalytic domain-containing protein, partial [Candidatus Babeliales bacterium]|nr:alcohol dehydrogenase catalytic domain-containing protein [Candidatus Babeliales bacterium]